MTALADRRTAVYRLFDAAGALLYVGASCNPQSRIPSHKDKPWWQEVADTSVEWFADRVNALRHEAAAIADESPRYNRDTPDPERVRAPRSHPKPRDLSGRTWPEAMRAAGIRPWRDSESMPDKATQRAAITAYLRWKREARTA